ncbi:MAG: glycosyltransferase [Planctomycetota bacterium]
MTPTNPKVSILLPVYNAERYLDETLRSLRGQTYDQFELIAIDDGSTDASLEILRRHEADDARLRIVSRPNTGLVAALNEMLALARGELCARMDADDIALPHRIERQVRAMDARSELVCLGGAIELIDERGAPLHRPAPVCGDSNVQREALRGRTPICHPASMFRTEAVRMVGGYHEDAYPAEDLDLWLRLGEIGEIDNIPETILRYRLHEESISVRKRERQIAKMRLACERAWARRGIVDGVFLGHPEHTNADERFAQFELAVHTPVQNPTARAILLAGRSSQPGLL